jgi:hypothetical protein
MQNKYTQEILNKDFGKEIDSLLQTKQTAKMNLATSTMELLQMGVKTIKGGTMSALPGLNVDEFNRCGQQEFSWESEDNHGKVLPQFQGAKQNHFGDIDQSKLSKFRWVSNFYCETDNTDKRAIIELDFLTGKFNFMNGFVPQEVRAKVDDIFPAGESPKLILKVIKRESSAVSFPEGTVSETYKYNRYLIGWETKSRKVILCVEPNGFVHFWYNKETTSS